MDIDSGLGFLSKSLTVLVRPQIEDIKIRNSLGSTVSNPLNYVNVPTGYHPGLLVKRGGPKVLSDQNGGHSDQESHL